MRLMAQIGQCALCRRNGEELQDSHFLPAGVYRVIRDEREVNPDPLKFNDHGVFQNSAQVSDYLLCHKCEERLNKNGECWFLANYWRKKQFRLASLLEAEVPEVIFPRIKIYHAARIPRFNNDALTYFPASMFWRASVHRWRMAGKRNRGIELGPYEEQVRKYLLGEAQFPQDCVLWVSVPENITPMAGLSLTPYGGRKGGHHAYKLILLGVGFHLLVGRRLPAEYREMCFVRGRGNPIFRTDMLEDAIMQDIHYKFSLHPQLLDGPRCRESK